MLHFDTKRYLIGSIAEGTQRASVQEKARLLKASEIFITGRTEWSNVGGLIGMILTLADSASSSAASSKEEIQRKIHAKIRRDGQGELNDEAIQKQMTQEVKDKTRLRIFGAPNLNYLLATARRFVFRKGMPVDVQEIGHHQPALQLPGDIGQEFRPIWSDENINVWAMSISPESIKSSQTVRPHGAVSPRKRSYDELNDVQLDESNIRSDKDKTAMMAKAVVSEMFDSEWRLDALVETPINDVQLPATLFVKDQDTGRTVKYTGPMPGGSEPVPDIKVLVRRPWPGALIGSLPPSEPARESMSYIIKNHYQRGRFMPQRAMELDVEKGVKWSALSSGKSVENTKGETITPDMVLEEGKEGNGIAIVDLPSTDYVEALINRPEWKAAQLMNGLSAFVWMLGPGVASSPLLQQFMSEMKDKRHIVSSPDICPNRISFDSAAAATTRLQRVDPARYGIPVHQNTSESSSQVPSFCKIADRGLKILIEPIFGLQEDMVTPHVKFDEVMSAMSPEVLRAAASAQDDIAKSKTELDAWAEKLPQKDAEIITLGTGSALPSKYRNVSATLVRVPGWGSLLLDCGENTLGQLKRLYTNEQFSELMHDLRAIWISHMHADHHLGTVSVIKSWYQSVHGASPLPVPSPATPDFDQTSLLQDQKRLAVIADVPMLHWLHEYSNIEDYGFSRLTPLAISPAYPRDGVASKLNWFVPPSTKSKVPHAQEHRQMEKTRVPATALGLSDVQAVLVQHCHGARAVSFTFPSGFKVSYSGDCRPSKAFSQIGKGSTVCIHEATFDDELQGDAEAKNHTTTSEALNVALAMDAKACVLTHFSQRYQKVPVLEYTDQDDGVSSFGGTIEDTSTNPDDSMDVPISDVAAATAPADASEPAPQEATKHTTIKLKRGTEMKVCVAFDLMRVKVGEIAQLEKMTPTLIELFAEEEKVEGKEQDGKPQKAVNKKQKAGKSKRNN